MAGIKKLPVGGKNGGLARAKGLLGAGYVRLMASGAEKTKKFLNFSKKLEKKVDGCINVFYYL
jgi:hypothetical protein